jgi:hypothetical protein
MESTSAICLLMKWQRSALLIFAISASFIYGGCTGAGRNQPSIEGEVNLTFRFVPANSGLTGTNFKEKLGVIRKGLRKNAMILVAPSSVCASLKGASGPMMLEGWATPVFNVGDGLEMDMFVRRAGEPRLVGSRYFDAGRKFEDRDWIPIAFPLDLGQDDQLEIDVSAGPQGDLSADWLALSSLRLVPRKTAP